MTNNLKIKTWVSLKYFSSKWVSYHRSSLWRNRLARSTFNRKVGGSSPPKDVAIFFFSSRTKYFSEVVDSLNGDFFLSFKYLNLQWSITTVAIYFYSFIIFLFKRKLRHWLVIQWVIQFFFVTSVLFGKHCSQLTAFTSPASSVGRASDF